RPDRVDVEHQQGAVDDVFVLLGLLQAGLARVDPEVEALLSRGQLLRRGQHALGVLGQVVAPPGRGQRLEEVGAYRPADDGEGAPDLLGVGAGRVGLDLTGRKCHNDIKLLCSGSFIGATPPDSAPGAAAFKASSLVRLALMAASSSRRPCSSVTYLAGSGPGAGLIFCRKSSIMLYPRWLSVPRSPA